MEQTITFSLNDEQLENFENILLEAKHSLPDDEEEFKQHMKIALLGLFESY